MRLGDDRLPKRFWRRVQVTPDGCWRWTGGCSNNYGSFWWNGRRLGAHRVAYMVLIGNIPDGLTIDHLCKNTVCVHPLHMEPVPLLENLARRKYKNAPHGTTVRAETGCECEPCANPRLRVVGRAS